MEFELPTTYVYPEEYGTSRSSGFTVPSPGAIINRMVQERSAAYARGDWAPMLERHLHAMHSNRPAYGLDGFIMGDLKVAHGADLLLLKNPNLSTSDAWNQGIKEGSKIQNNSQLAVPTEFSGGAFTPFKAIQHWLLGNGNTASVQISRIGINPTPDKIPDLMAIINTAGIGETTVNLSTSYYTGQDSFIPRIYLGTITLNITGKVIRNTSGTVSFSGVVKAFSDRYDANASSHRTGFDEAATTALREVGRVANAKDYAIQINGELPISYAR